MQYQGIVVAKMVENRLPVFDVANRSGKEELACQEWKDECGGWHTTHLIFGQMGNARVYWSVYRYNDGFETSRYCTIVCATRPGKDIDGNLVPSVQSIASSDAVAEWVRKEIGRHLMIAL